MGFLKDGRKLPCGFCGKHADAVKQLIAGPQVSLCNECVNICLEILLDETRTTGNAVQQTLPCWAEVETQLLESYYFRQLGGQQNH